MDPKSLKALFRRGLTFHGLKDYRMARDDFVATLLHEPNNKATRNYLIFCNNAIKAELKSIEILLRNCLQSKRFRRKRKTKFRLIFKTKKRSIARILLNLWKAWHWMKNVRPIIKVCLFCADLGLYSSLFSFVQKNRLKAIYNTKIFILNKIISKLYLKFFNSK